MWKGVDRSKKEERTLLISKNQELLVLSVADIADLILTLVIIEAEYIYLGLFILENFLNKMEIPL